MPDEQRATAGERATASEPGERSAPAKRRAREPVGEFEGRSLSKKIERRLLILWFALAFVVWNGVYDMRMHDSVRGYLLETAEAQAGLGRGVDMQQYLHRGRVDAVAFSTAWAGGVFLAGIATMYTYRRLHAADLKVRPTEVGRGFSPGDR